MKYVKLMIFVAFFFVFGPCLLMAGGGQEAQTVTLDFMNWVTAEEAARPPVEDVIAHFESENPDVKVNSMPIGFSEHTNQLTIMYNAGDAPDLAQASGPDSTLLTAMGALASADEIFPKDFRDDLIDGYFDLTLVDGVHYGVPWAPIPLGMLYNRNLLKQAGLDPSKPPNTIYDFDDYVEKARQVLPEEIVIFAYDTTVRVFAFNSGYPFLRAFGAMPITKDNVNYNTPEIKEYCEWLRTSIRNSYTLPGKKLGEFRPIGAQGRLVFTFDGSFVRGIMISINTSITDEEFNNTWGAAAVPGDKQGNHYAYSADHQLVVFEDSKHKEAAVRLSIYLTDSDYSLTNYIAKMGYPPATKSALDRIPAFAKDPIMADFTKYIADTVTPMPFSADYNEIVIPFAAGVQEVITTDKSIEAILSSVQEKIDRVRK